MRTTCRLYKEYIRFFSVRGSSNCMLLRSRAFSSRIPKPSVNETSPAADVKPQAINPTSRLLNPLAVLDKVRVPLCHLYSGLPPKIWEDTTLIEKDALGNLLSSPAFLTC